MQDISIYSQEIAKKHGIVLKKNDPMMIMYTFLEIFLNDMRSQQEEILRTFVATMEEDHTKWNTETKARAERILSVALDAASKISAEQTQLETEKMLTAMSMAMKPQLEKLESQSIVVVVQT